MLAAGLAAVRNMFFPDRQTRERNRTLDQLAAYHVHVDIRRPRAWYFPPPFRKPEGVQHRWAQLRIAERRVWWRNHLAPGYLALLCRIGLHFIIKDHWWQADAWSCECRRNVLPREVIRR